MSSPIESTAPAIGRSDALTPESSRMKQVVWAVVVLGGLLTLWLTRHAWAPSSILYGRRADAPPGFSWLALGTTRGAFLEKMKAQGNTWRSIEKPGMAPNAWAPHSDVTLDGVAIPQLAILFSDGQKYDYGAIPKALGDPVEPARLLGGSPADAKVVGIRWKVARSFFEESSDDVPARVLRELGQPHSEERDITGFARNHKWEWPSTEATYFGVDGSVVITLREEASKIDQFGGPGNLPGMPPPGDGPPAGEASTDAADDEPAAGEGTDGEGDAEEAPSTSESPTE